MRVDKGHILSTQDTSVVAYGESHLACQWMMVHGPQQRYIYPQTDVHLVKLMCLNYLCWHAGLELPRAVAVLM